MEAARRRLIGSLLLSAIAPWADAAEVLAIAATNKGGGGGVAALLLDEIYRRAGLRMQVLVVPGARATMMALSGEVDGELIRIPTYGQHYARLLRVDPAYYRVSVRAYSLPARNALVHSREDLQHYSVGAIRGMLYGMDLTERHPALTLTQNSLQMFRMLQAGRLDVVLSSSIAARTSAGRLGLRDLVESPELVRLELHHYLHLRHQELAPRLGDVIRRMKASGELERLTLQYEAVADSDDGEPVRGRTAGLRRVGSE